MAQFPRGLRRQFFAVGRFPAASNPIAANTATARFKVSGVKAAVRYGGELMPTADVAANMAAIVHHSGHRARQKIMRIREKESSSQPNKEIQVSRLQWDTPAS